MRRTARSAFLSLHLLAALAAFAAATAAGCAGPRSPGSRGGAAAATATGGAPANGEILGIDPGTTVGKLDNGLTYFIRKNGKPEKRAEIWLAVNVGSIQEDDDQRGLAHFLEHMAFNGTARFPKLQIVEYLEKIGMRFGPHVNAYTSFDETVYQLHVPTDDPAILEKSFDILEDWSRAITIADEDVEKERGVVLEERRLGRGAEARLMDKQFPVVFRGSRYAERLVIGDEKTLRTAPPEALRRFYRDWYRPDLMAVVAVGDFDPKQVEALIRARFSGLKGPATPRPRQTAQVPDHDETLVTVATDPELPATLLALVTKLPRRPQGTAADYRQQILLQLYQSMFNARLSELQRKANAPFLAAGAMASPLVRAKEVFVGFAMVKQDGILGGLTALLTELERVAQHGFTSTELERAKRDLERSYEKSQREQGKRASRSHAEEMLRHFFAGETMPGIDKEVELAARFLPAITAGDVNALTREWAGAKNRVVTVSAPEGAKLPTVATIHATLEAAEKAAVTSYTDVTSSGPLLASPPRPGTVISEKAIPEVGVTEWKLSNGATMILRPNDGQNDEIRLTGFSPGGYSLAPERDLESARAATAILMGAGAGEHTGPELSKRLAGKRASVSLFVGELEEWVSGGASPQDLETLFQLLYLKMTQPRRDADAFAAWRAQAIEAAENRTRSPDAVFGEAITKVMTRNHPHRRPTTRADIEKVDLDRALAFYRDRFADASDFTFVLVGNFEPANVKPLVLTYLAGLPSLQRKERWKDVGIPHPAHAQTIAVEKGLEPKSRVNIKFWGDARWTRQDAYDLDTLANVLGTRLREVLREELGGVYGVSVHGGISRRPRERYSFTISFGCAPESVESLVAAVTREIEALRTEGIEESYLENVRAAERRSFEVAVKENSFWEGQLADHYRHGMDPRLILKVEPLIQSVSSKRVRAAARKYLVPKRRLEAVLRPESRTP